MKNKMKKFLALLAALMMLSAVSLAAAETRITVSGTGETRISADTAVISMGVSARDRDVLKAQQTVNEHIAKIRQALLDCGVEVVSVSHLHMFAASFHGRQEVQFLRAERLESGQRTFRLLPGEPQETAYGEDIYKRVFAED